MYIPSYLLNIYVCFFKIERGANVEIILVTFGHHFMSFWRFCRTTWFLMNPSGSQMLEYSVRRLRGGCTREHKPAEPWNSEASGRTTGGEEEHKDLTRLMTQRGRRICVPVAARFKNRTVARVRMNLLGNFHNMMWCFCSQTRRLTTMSFESFKQSSLTLNPSMWSMFFNYGLGVIYIYIYKRSRSKTKEHIKQTQIHNNTY